MTEPGHGTGGSMPTNPDRQTVLGSYASYVEAERAVDHLADNGFAVERTAISGRGLSSYEQVTGRLTTWKAALRGAASGAVIGALLGWLFGIFSWVDPLISGLLLALYGLVIGAVTGAVLGALGHVMSGGRRDFSSVPGVRAEVYEVLVDAEVAAQAEQLLDAPGAPGHGSATLAR